MAKASRKDPRLKALIRINRALDTVVMDTLREVMPEVRALPKGQTLSYILDDLGLLARCFIAYRENPEKFRRILHKPHRGGAVLTSDELLYCGRSFDEVVGLIVRTSAKRHFLQEIDHDMRPFRSGKFLSRNEMSLIQVIKSFFGQKFERPKEMTKGMQQYEAIADHIHHDWQVPLVPEYAVMPIEIIEKLGEQILDYKLASELQQLRQDPDNPPPPSKLKPRPLFVPPPPEKEIVEAVAEEPEPAVMSGTITTSRVDLVEVPTHSTEPTDRRARLDEVLTGDGKRVKVAAFNTMLLDPAIQALLPENTMSVRVGDVLSLVGGNAVKMLVNTLGLRQDQLAVMLICAHGSFGEKPFVSLFGPNGRIDAVTSIIGRMQDSGITQDTPLEDIAAMANRKFTA